MLVHISKLLGRMTGLRQPGELETTEHSPLTKPLCSVKVLISTADQEQEQLILPSKYDTVLKRKNAL